MAQSIHLIGLNHRTAAVEVREKFALTEFCTAQAWPFLRAHGVKDCSVDAAAPAVTESLILSTCNRVEVLAVVNSAKDDDGSDQLLEAWCAARGQTVENLRPYIYHYKDIDAVRHLFSVASSLDSLVLGEPQILGQLKKAYRLSVEAGQAGLLVNRLLHRAFSVAKRVRTETAVASSAVSISYAAVELAKRIFDDMSRHEALLIGAGEMAELAAMHLINSGIRKLRIVNRTYARAEELAERIGGDAYTMDTLLERLEEADIIISSTGAQDAVILPDMVKSVLKKRRNRPMFFIDIAMPRDIDPAVNNFDNVYLYDIDDLKEVVEENQAQRKEEAQKARTIVLQEAENFEEWRGSLGLQPTIVEIIRKGEEMAQEEVARTLRRLGSNDPNLRDALEKMAQSLMNKANHAPLEYLHNSYRHTQSLQAVATVRGVLGLDKKM